MRRTFIVSILCPSRGFKFVERLTPTPQCERVFSCRTGTRGCTRASIQDGSDRFGRLVGHSRRISCCHADRDFTLPCTSRTRALALSRLMSCYNIDVSCLWRLGWYRLKDIFPWNAIRIDDIRVHYILGFLLVLPWFQPIARSGCDPDTFAFYSSQLL